jgi:uncharacterized protein (DUF1330 family)
MIFLTQLIYVREDRKQVFHDFESIVLPLLGRHGGELLLRLRPDAASIVGGSAEPPYEVHVVSFQNEDSLTAYMSDPARRAVLHMKDASVRSSMLIKGAAG